MFSVHDVNILVRNGLLFVLLELVKRKEIGIFARIVLLTPVSFCVGNHLTSIRIDELPFVNVNGAAEAKSSIASLEYLQWELSAFLDNLVFAIWAARAEMVALVNRLASCKPKFSQAAFFCRAGVIREASWSTIFVFCTVLKAAALQQYTTLLRAPCGRAIASSLELSINRSCTRCKLVRVDESKGCRWTSIVNFVNQCNGGSRNRCKVFKKE